MEERKEELCRSLYRIGAVKFGEFTLKSGLKSPIYLDLRMLISYPRVLRKVANQLMRKTIGLKFDRICGIPYAAISIATALSLQADFPMVYPRKESKGYGTRKDIEGKYEKGEVVLVYDDLITRGDSKIEAIKPLEKVGLVVRDIMVLIDREQGGKEELKKKGYKLHSVLTLRDILKCLKKQKFITNGQYEDVQEYLQNPEKWTKKHK